MNEQPHFLDLQAVDVRDGCELKAWSLPFPAVRSFTIRNYSGGERERGGHAHRVQWQALQVVSGRAFVHMERRDGWQQKFLIYSVEDCVLVVPPMTWLTMRLHDGSRLLAVASGVYDEGDYIRDRAVWEAL